MLRKLLSLLSTSVLCAGLMTFGIVASTAAVSGASFTTVNETADGTGHCKNGNPGVNCNIYDGKEFVWLNGGPATASLANGDYVFAVLDPGGQGSGQNPNDCTDKNLSDASPCDTSSTGAGDAWTNRTFSVSGGAISYAGTHDFDSNEIRLMPYDDTPNLGGVYILAICSLKNATNADPQAAENTNPPGVVPSDCKYDAFKINTSDNCPPDCGTGQGVDLGISKTADGAYDTTFKWDVTKSVDTPSVKTAGGASTTANYTVTVTHDNGSNGKETVSGKITVTNPNPDPVLVDAVTDQLSNGTDCDVTNGTNFSVPGNDGTTDGSVDLAYTCPVVDLDLTLTNTATVSWSDQFLSPSGIFVFGGSLPFVIGVSATQTKVDECVSVDDSVQGHLGDPCASDTSPIEYKYQGTISGDAGTCTDNPNTATVGDTGGPLASAGANVQDCQGADLTVTKTASPAYTRTYNWTISKSVDKTHVDQNGGNVTFNYQVVAAESGFTDSGWQVTGSITVTNPNDWEDVTVDITDAVDNGGTCTVTNGTGVVVPKSDHVSRNYTCTYSSKPADGTNTATASWDKDAASTPDASNTGTASIHFGDPTTLTNKTIHVTDCWGQAGYVCTGTALGTLTATDTTPYTSHTYTYSHTVPAPPNACVEYDNSAKITETGQHSDKAVTVCGTGGVGALTMGFWQNKNGQGIISGGAYTGLGKVCNSATWLRQFNPFSDLSASATCSQTASYVYNVIKVATCTSTTKTCNSMLKAQMLATALDVYFSDPALGGNKIGAPAGAPIGGDKINLTKICTMSDSSGGSTCSGSYKNVSAQFGGSTCMTVMNMLLYQNTSDPASPADAGAVWYGQVKASQVNAKDAFDSINNQKAFAC